MGLCVCPVGRKDGITSLFDTPAYLTPSLETVFDSIMQTFPTSRSTVKSGEDCAEQVGEGELDEDGVLEDDSPLIVKNAMRVVDEFVKIFKHYEPTGMNGLSVSNRPDDNKVVPQLCGPTWGLLK